MRSFAAIFAAAILCAAPARAQNLALEAPAWAQALVAADIIPTTGGRTEIRGAGVDLSARITIAPARGGVARVIRYEARGDEGRIALRRFVGHGNTGWWLWGADTPSLAPVSEAARRELRTLIRAALRANEDEGAPCLEGEAAFIEIANAERAIARTRACVRASEAAGRLALYLSELAGSRTEDELVAAGAAEVMAADRAFAAMAQAEGAPAAFARYAAEDALIVTSGEIIDGRAGVIAAYADWPAGARLEWAPRHARVSMRGDMAWTWGDSVFIAPDGARRPGRYVSVWTRDMDGAWRFAFDAPIR